jgi:hypothetical protein
MKMAAYWEAQENRWHERYIEAEKLIDQLESKVWNQASRIYTLEVSLRKISEINNKRDRFSSEIDWVVTQELGGIDV